MKAYFKNKFAIAALTLFLTLILLLFISRFEFNFLNKSAGNITYEAYFTGSSTCKQCHEEEYEAWTKSDHYKAMQTAGSETVLGNFENAVFKSKGFTNRMFKKGDSFYMQLENREGRPDTFKIAYTFGYYPLQQYLIEFPDGRYQCTHIAWDSKDNKWFDLYPDLQIHSSEWLHWTGGSQTWNSMCADCHSTNLQKNYNAGSDSYHTTYNEINIACEACHGPGSEHVRLSMLNPDAEEVQGKIYLGRNSEQQEQMQFCVRCHSRRSQLNNSFNHNEHWMQQYSPEILRPGLYHADGQILDEVYVWGSFTQSKMYREGVKCIDCHDPHTYKRRFEGNRLCLQCHDINVYDNRSHHFHNPGSEGAKCESCHMPGQYYMVNDYRPDHSFRVPRPDLSVKYDVPNACNECHSDKTADWASAHVEKWYGKERRFHFSELLLKAAHNQSDVKEIKRFINSDTIPDIAKATAVYHLQNYAGSEAWEVLINALDNPSELVRRTALEGLDMYNSTENTGYFVKMLYDTARIVRHAAFNSIAGTDVSSMPADVAAQFNSVSEDFFTARANNADFPSEKLFLGQYYHRTGQTELAKKYYEETLKKDNYQNMARMNLALIYNSAGENEKAVSLLKKVTEQEPLFDHAWYSLGILYAEMNRPDSAIYYLTKTTEINSHNSSAYYNLGLLYQQQLKIKEAEKAFSGGLKNNPGNERLLYAMSHLYLQTGNSKSAAFYIKELNRLYPGRPEYRELLNIIDK